MHLTVADGALVTIAVAASIQALVTVSVTVAGVMVWRRASQGWERERAALHARLDEVMSLVRTTSSSVDRMSNKASGVADDAQRMLSEVGGVVRTASTVALAPRTLLAAGAAAGARALIRRWRSAR